MLVALSLGAGLLSAVAALPVIGVAGIAVKNASQTFNDLPVAGLGQVPSKTEILNKSGKVLAIYYPRGIYRDPVSWHQIAPVMRERDRRDRGLQVLEPRRVRPARHLAGRLQRPVR